MAQLSNPQWTPPNNNPVPCTTSVTFTVTPGIGVSTVRIRYTLNGTQLRFTLPSPGPAGSTPVQHSATVLEEDHPVATLNAPIVRAIALESTNRGHPAFVSLTVSAADIRVGAPSIPSLRLTSITFALAGPSADT